jgi:DNA-binding response OmpR family regulator
LKTMTDNAIILNSRILIVDDQAANVLLLERILQQSGYRNVVSLTDSRQVMDQFQMFQPDLLLLDLMMPKVDGYAIMTELCGWIAGETYFPILVITADVSNLARQRALSLGAKDFLTKPIDTTEATLRIYNLLETRWLYRQLQGQNQVLTEQVRESRQQLEALRAELERIAQGGGLPTDQFAVARTRIAQAVSSIERFGETLKCGVVAFGVLAIANLMPQLKAQSSVSSTALTVRVEPEARLSQSQVPIQFLVSSDGTADVVSQSAIVAAWIRAMPGQQIHLTARAGAVTGPSGATGAAEIRWNGSLTSATVGGQSATCTTGLLVSNTWQALVTGWQQSGTLICSLKFELTNPRVLAPGAYAAVVDLDLRAE